MDATRRTGLLVAAAAAVPFCLAPLTAGGPALACPLLSVTGVPCPLCGGTRAFRAAAGGDLAFLTHNGWWVLLAVATFAGGLVVAVTGRALPRPRDRAWLATLVAGLLVGPWVWAASAAAAS